MAYAEELEKTKNFNRDSAQDTRSINEIMSPYLNNDRIHEMHDQERNAIWAKRLVLHLKHFVFVFYFFFH